MNEEHKVSILLGIKNLVEECYGSSFLAGWWSDIETTQPKELTVELILSKLALIHSELSESLEGFRKDKMDDHLPQRKQAEVELADAVIRICDLAGACGMDLAGAIIDKMEYNSNRQDHKIENRRKSGGKKA